jgi:hypothetical protein
MIAGQGHFHVVVIVANAHALLSHIDMPLIGKIFAAKYLSVQM